jgi:hypothetical protein
MNSLFKNSNSMIRSANLLKSSFLRLPKFNFFSLNKINLTNLPQNDNAFSSDLIKNKNLHLLKISKNSFSDKKDKEPEKKPEEEKKEGKSEENKPKGSEEEPKNNPNENKDENKDKDDKSILIKLLKKSFYNFFNDYFQKKKSSFMQKIKQTNKLIFK